ncbi:MAG TPA: DinB family protein [Actinomycetes bacterium]|nr:DinB family protein [Actinomycetes bacterium]
MAAYAVGRLDEIEEQDDAGCHYRPIRHHLGVTAFGVTAWTAHAAGDVVVAEHDQGDPTADEELFLVQSGHAVFEVDGDRIDAPAGTLVFAPPRTKRSATAQEAGTAVIAVEGTPGRAYAARGWELWAPLAPLYAAGAHAEVADRLTAVVAASPQYPMLFFNLACCESLTGRTADALGHLRRAIELSEEFRRAAEHDSDLDPIRDDPEFDRLVRGRRETGTSNFSRADDLAGAAFTGVNLRGARFVESDLSGVVMRGVDVSRLEIDAPWLPHSGHLRVNDVDVIPLVEAELDRRFPGRADRRATDGAGLRAAWAACERAWAAAVERAEAMPAGTVDESVAGEWSFAQTLRHLVSATDIWLGRAVLGLEQPYHPLGQMFDGAGDEGFDLSVLTTDQPSWAEVLEARAGRVAMVRDFLATVTPDELDVPRRNPWSPQEPETTRSCLHVILEEEWEHLRFATRDLDAIAAGRTSADDGG